MAFNNKKSPSKTLCTLFCAVLCACTFTIVNNISLLGTGQITQDRSSPLFPTISTSVPYTKDGRKFAIAYVVAGCKPNNCKGYVLNAVAASRALLHFNSTLPVFFKVRMASSTPPNSRLSRLQETWLRKAGIHLEYLPRVKVDNFGTITLEKFRVLEMTEYDRVLFLDSDNIPKRNVDYYFHASYDGILSPYVGVAGAYAPINAGTFLVTPGKGLFGRVMDLIHRQRAQRDRFDQAIGWGHKIAKNDPWHATKTSRTNWTMWGAQIDQGLLFHFFKYEMLNWSLQNDDGTFEQWQEVPSSWKNSFPDAVFEVPNKKFIYRNITNPRPIARNLKDDFLHFRKGRKKPWQKPINGKRIASLLRSNGVPPEGNYYFWLYFLGEANRTFSLNLPTQIPEMSNHTPFEFNGKDKRQLFLTSVELPVPQADAVRQNDLSVVSVNGM